MSYRDLTAWQLAMDLVEQVYRLTERFPDQERFGLTAQMRRAAVSIPSNLAEGQGRRSAGAFTNPVLIARGSLLEVETQALIAARLGYLEHGVMQGFLARSEELSKVLHGLARATSPDSRLPTPD